MSIFRVTALRFQVSGGTYRRRRRVQERNGSGRRPIFRLLRAQFHYHAAGVGRRQLLKLKLHAYLRYPNDNQQQGSPPKASLRFW